MVSHGTFSRKRHRDEVVQKVLDEEPFMLVGSPPCTMFSILQNGNRHRHTPAAWAEMMKKAEVHIQFCITLYEIQRRAGRYYLHEHPRTATSWGLKGIQRFKQYADTQFIHCNMCQFGMVTTHKGQTGLVEKATTFMTNSDEVAVRLNRRCSKTHKTEHLHLPIWGKRARDAQVYPKELCKAVTEGVWAQRRADDAQLCGMDLGVLGIDDSDDCSLSGVKDFASACLRDLGAVEEVEPIDEQHDADIDTEHWQAFDDTSGKELDAATVHKARLEEMEFMDKMGVYTVVPVSEAWTVTGKAPIRSRWVDVNKGDDVDRNYRSRWVAQEIKTDKGQWELFAGTPPLEAVRYIVSMCASTPGNAIMSNDISRAYLFADVRKPIFVKLPDEAARGGDPNVCARLLKSLYGTRDAACNWAAWYTGILIKHGFVQGKSNPCLYYHKDKDLLTLVHGDDFLSTGAPEVLKWLEKILGDALTVKTKLLGPLKMPGAKQQIMFLNRVLTWDNTGIRYELDPRHAEMVIRELNLQEAKSVTTPGVPNTGPRSEEDHENPLLVGPEASRFRGVVARTNVLAQDRMDLQFASKEASRWMARPRRGDWDVMKRIGRYLQSHPRVTTFFCWQAAPTELVAYSDTDWAGCKTTRRSTSGGVVMHGLHLLRSWSRMQNLVSLSSAEAELYGTVRASSELLGCRSMARDFGRNPGSRLYADASAALGIIQRQGLGKVRHLETNTPWLQQAARTKLISFQKVVGEHNPADALTKHLAEEPRRRHTAFCGLEWLPGRAEIAPKVSEDVLAPTEKI